MSENQETIWVAVTGTLPTVNLRVSSLLNDPKVGRQKLPIITKDAENFALWLHHNASSWWVDKLRAKLKELEERNNQR